MFKLHNNDSLNADHNFTFNCVNVYYYIQHTYVSTLVTLINCVEFYTVTIGVNVNTAQH